MRINYNKLIRDNIPDIIEATGKRFETDVYNDDQYQAALWQKLGEESEEAKNAANRRDLVKEIADIFEVVDALLAFYEIDRSEVFELQEKRKQGRGGFVKRLKLLWVEEPD